jgi:ribulose-phosphate 3-epimerase
MEAAGADWIHLDVIDGHFAPNLTFGPWVVEMTRKVTKLPIDVHLMIEDPITFGPTFARAGADYVVVHVEATAHLHRALFAIKEAGARPGVALNPMTPLGFLEPCLDSVDLVVVMGVNPAFSGQAFIPETLGRVRETAKILATRDSGPLPLLEVDGGVNDQNGRLLAQAGAGVLVSGSYLFRSKDYRAAIASLRF